MQMNSTRSVTFVLLLSLLTTTAIAAQDLPELVPHARDFPVTSQPHTAAPPEVNQFGRLVGVWDAQTEIRTQDGSWVPDARAVWIWKYALDGFATQDLWLHPPGHLPSYLTGLDRSYMLTGLRVYDPEAEIWRCVWAANGGRQVPGPDFGQLTGRSVPVPAAERKEGVASDRMVLHGESDYGKQRITFHDLAADSFSWLSEVSQDGGKTWNAFMRVKATRRRAD